LKSIFRSILCFETAFEVIVPQSRRGNEYAKSNWIDNPKLRGKTRVQCFQLIEQCSNNIDITNITNPGDIRDTDGDRYYGWNFMNLVYGGIMTIDFCGGPGVTEAEQCLDWVKTSSHLHSSCKELWHFCQSGTNGTNAQGLRQFIHLGLERGVSTPELFTAIFKDKSGQLWPIRLGNLTEKTPN
jgi:hypothetical protein